MQATIFEETFCRLCLNTIRDSNCRVIEEVIRDVLKIVLPHVSLEEKVTHFMCVKCSVKLFAALNFKSICMDTEDLIFPYINASKMSMIDLKEVYFKEKGNIQLMVVSDDQRICRLCFQLVTYGFVALNEVDVDIIDAYIPQVNIRATRDPLICTVCFDSLRTHGSFLKNCLDAHEKYTNVHKQSYIKTEEIEIKPEDDQDSDTLPETFNNEPFEKSDWKDAADDGCKPESKAANKRNMKTKQGRKVSYKCDKCIYETGSERCFTAHRARHENDSVVYKCESCKYETKDKKLLQKHQLRHKNISKIRMHRYESGNYKTKCTSNLAKHPVKHKAQLYKCNVCHFKTKCRTNFNSHYLKHKDSSKYDELNCKTNCKALPHKNTSNLTIYKCDGCSYESLNKGYFIKHQLTHKDPSQVQTYRCNECDYETKYRRCNTNLSIKIHLRFKCTGAMTVTTKLDTDRKSNTTYRNIKILRWFKRIGVTTAITKLNTRLL
ncbi:zinc finger protein 43-like [Anoplophora glabripennis]|uniref:zinc finger protein 43-like n=1 Tax=Anoplophora glabripennis TaxID=217634 RepID=UPI000C76B7AA|nr:zinc finger protein 43-like [Anoplophora glabripennis]